MEPKKKKAGNAPKGVVPPQFVGVKKGRNKSLPEGDDGRRPVELVNNEETRAWERQPHEPTTAYHAFSIYRDMGYHRKQKKVAAELGTSVRVVTAMSYRWKWMERLKLWDKWKDEVRREAQLREIDDMAKRHINSAMLTERALLLPVEALLRRAKDDLSTRNFDGVAPGDLFILVTKSADAMQKMVNVERSSRGEPTEINKTDLTSVGEIVKVIFPTAQAPKVEEETRAEDKARNASEGSEEEQ